MTPAQLTNALAKVRYIARQAGTLLQEGQRRGFHVEHKGEVELVTEYDRRAEALIVSELSQAYPQHRVIGEEGSDVPGQAGQAGAPEQAGQAEQAIWYIDPLDGTTNYAHGIPFYAVSIGLELAGEPALGVIYAPELGWEFTAVRGQGASLNGEAIRVSKTTTLDQSVIATGFAYDRREIAQNNLAEFSAVIMQCQGIRRMGSAALDCAMVARGLLDGYWELRLKPWDVSAGALIVREAGGQVSDVDGGTFSSTSGRVIATNGLIHDQLLEALK